MHSDLQRYLDGELSREELSPELLAQADDFERATRSFVRAQPDAPPWLEKRIMLALPAQPQASPWRRALSWLVEPRPIRISPLTASLATAAVTGLLLWPNQPSESAVQPAAPAATSAMPVSTNTVTYVQFVFAAPNAKSVAIAGDFNDWQEEGVLLRDTDGDGVWTGLIALRPGLHKYMFIVDGERWMTDPEAERYVDDGFGMRNAVITVTPPTGRAS